MGWRRLGSNTAGSAAPPPERPWYIDSRIAGLGNVIGWPLAGSVINWKKLMVARVKVEAWYYDEDGVRHADDFGGFGPWEVFTPTAWMAGVYSLKEEPNEDEEPGLHHGLTATMETSLCSPWMIVWRSRKRDLDSSDWEYTEHTQLVGEWGSYEVSLNAGNGERHEYYDSMILVPAD